MASEVARPGALILDARASIEAAPAVAGLMERELSKNLSWEIQQVDAFSQLAENYLATSLESQVHCLELLPPGAIPMVKTPWGVVT